MFTDLAAQSSLAGTMAHYHTHGGTQKQYTWGDDTNTYRWGEHIYTLYTGSSRPQNFFSAGCLFADFAIAVIFYPVIKSLRKFCAYF